MVPLIIQYEVERQKVIEEIKAVNPNLLYVWGDGSYSLIIKDYLRHVGGFTGRISTVVDDEYIKDYGNNAVPFSKLLALEDKEVPIVFGFYNYPMVKAKKEKWSSVFPHMYDLHFTVVNNRRLAWEPSKVKMREEDYRFTYNLLSDEYSRKVMQLYLDASLSGNIDSLFKACHEEGSYFNRITKDLNVDVLVDCGAYDGDSIHDFISVFPDYRKIMAFEPDMVNCSKIENRREHERIHDLEIIQKGVGAAERSLRFRAQGQSNSFLDDDGDTEIEIMTLDEACADVQGTMLVKMDIEGAEFDALKGASHLIREKVPILTICVYHREEDLATIPQYIHGLVGEGVYDYYLGYHGLDLAELVFYAVPKNRSVKCEATKSEVAKNEATKSGAGQ